MSEIKLSKREIETRKSNNKWCIIIGIGFLILGTIGLTLSLSARREELNSDDVRKVDAVITHVTERLSRDKYRGGNRRRYEYVASAVFSADEKDYDIEIIIDDKPVEVGDVYRVKVYRNSKGEYIQYSGFGVFVLMIASLGVSGIGAMALGFGLWDNVKLKKYIENK